MYVSILGAYKTNLTYIYYLGVAGTNNSHKVGQRGRSITQCFVALQKSRESMRDIRLVDVPLNVPEIHVAGEPVDGDAGDVGRRARV